MSKSTKKHIRKTYDSPPYQSTSSQTYIVTAVEYQKAYDKNYDRAFEGPPVGYDAVYDKTYTGTDTAYLSTYFKDDGAQYSNAPPGELDYGTDPAYFRGEQYLGPFPYDGQIYVNTNNI